MVKKECCSFRDKWAMAPTTLIWQRVGSNLNAIWIRTSNPRIGKVLIRDMSLIRSLFNVPSMVGDLPLTLTRLVWIGLGLLHSFFGVAWFGGGFLVPLGLLLCSSTVGGRVSPLGATLLGSLFFPGVGFCHLVLFINWL